MTKIGEETLDLLIYPALRLVERYCLPKPVRLYLLSRDMAYAARLYLPYDPKAYAEMVKASADYYRIDLPKPEGKKLPESG